MQFRRFVPPAYRLLIVSAVMLIALILYPVRNEITRLGIVASVIGVDGGLLLALRRRRWLLLSAAAPQILLVIFLVIPGRDSDPAALRAAYIAALNRYDGTRYVWGGENSLGVDCSGLLRTAFIDAQFRQAARSLNPRLLRSALWFWWNDASAREMADGYRGNTTVLGKPALLSAITPGMRPGDFAVTADGSHVLAYLGGCKWIEADPTVNRVIRFNSAGESQWGITRMTPCRWRALDDPSGR
jgi:hypothetical protein